MNNPFDIFKVSEIVEAINVIPNNYGRLQQMNLFPVKGVFTTEILVESKNGVLTLIQTEENGGPGVVGKKKGRNMRMFKIPQLVYDEHVNPREVQNARAFGSSQKAALSELLTEKLVNARAKHDITLEHLRMGALKGRILDADGSVLYDLYDEFGITPKVFFWDLENASFDVRGACHALKRYMEENLLGEVMSAVRVEVSGSFLDLLVKHPTVEKAYANWQAAADRLGGDVRDGFVFGGVRFVEYAASATDPDGNVRRFIADGEGHAYPLGTATTFRTYVGPADFNETVNKLGRIYYAKTLPAKFGRGYDIHTQSNPLPMCSRPQLLVTLKVGTGQ